MTDRDAEVKAEVALLMRAGLSFDTALDKARRIVAKRHDGDGNGAPDGSSRKPVLKPRCDHV